ncbi:hypothetical protein C5167_000231 [Papaver somniferum]|uniref:Uncharacterized protein n=1 Tax=Papaver somniferum TaxID=3469 RepID=A0A4Y7KVB3_PAPSO|nr:hypothetical protein C5167_000231 [Papaver somniferum]
MIIKDFHLLLALGSYQYQVLLYVIAYSCQIGSSSFGPSMELVEELRASQAVESLELTFTFVLHIDVLLRILGILRVFYQGAAYSY